MSGTGQGPPDLLVAIVERRRRRLGVDGNESWRADSALPSPRLPVEHPFLAALHAQSGRAVIAEVKRGSPRMGRLENLDPLAQAKAYREAGAAALSVVVEPDHFHGSYELLAECRRASGLPTLAKDFLVSPRQIDEARRAGADAILLVAALYDAAELAGWASLARQADLVPLVELHDEEDLAKLGSAEWELVGVNNRDLRTFEVDLSHSVAMAADLPSAALKVAESGIAERRQVELLAAAGFDAFLVG